MSCLLRRMPTPKSFTLPAAMLIVCCFKLAGKRMCRPLPFWPRWSWLLNRHSQLIKLQRVLQQVQAWVGVFLRHFHQACSPKQQPWQFLASTAGAANQMQGRPTFVVPLFVSTFSPPALSVAPSPSSVATRLLPTAFSSSPTVPLLQQSFVVAPGFSPIPPKLVSQIVFGKLVELSELLSSNIAQTQSDSDPQLFFDGWLVLTSMPKKPKQWIEDIGSWLEAFSVYCLMLTSVSPAMEGSPALSVVDFVDLSPVHRPGMAGLQLGLPRACSCN